MGSWRSSPRFGPATACAGEFFPLLEQTGRTGFIDRQVLAEGTRQICEWNERFGTRLRLAVNLSARSLARPDLLTELREVLSESCLDPSLLELEITETDAIGDEATNLATLNDLAALGVSISIDDFGTGYSSLSYLRHLPIKRLKLDRQFVRDLPHSRDCAAIVEAVVSLAHSLGISVTAEGVETAEQLRYLKSTGCEEVQGHWFDPALSPSDLEMLLLQLTIKPVFAG